MKKIILLLCVCGMSFAAAAPVITGITQAVSEARLSMAVSGRVEAILVKEGESVKRGKLLLHLDRALEQLDVRRRELVVRDTAHLDELRQRQTILGKQVDSARELLGRGGVSRKQVEDEALALQAINAELETTRSTKQRDQVELDLAEEAYQRRHLYAPFTGTVIRIAARVGESVPANEPLVHLVDVSRVRFMGTVPVADSYLLRPGMAAQVKIGSGTTATTRPAQLRFVSPIADPASGLVEVIAEFDNTKDTIRPGVVGELLLAP